MARILTKRLLVSLLSLALITQGAFAQGNDDYVPRSTGPRKQMATIIFSGLAGAVLGLSTLSFYGRPQDKLGNILVGFAVGVVIGTTYTTYKAATQPRDFYGQAPTSGVLFPETWRISEASGETQAEGLNLSYAWTYDF